MGVWENAGPTHKNGGLHSKELLVSIEKEKENHGSLGRTKVS